MHCDDFKKLFPNGVETKYVRDNAEVIEREQSAKVKKIIWKNGGAQVYDTSVIKFLTSFFQQTESDRIFNRDCDGILVYDGKDSRKHIILCELKSSFDTSVIYDAYKQIISSCIKFRMLLNLLPNYRQEDYKVRGFIFSNIKKIEKRDLYKRTQLPGTKSEEADFLLKVCFKDNEPYEITPHDISFIKHLPLGTQVLFDKLELYHIEVDNPDGICEMDVRQYLI